MYVKAKVTAGAKKESVEKVSADQLKITVREKAEGNRANERVKEVIAEYFGIPASAVRLIKGHHAPAKIFDITM